MVPADGYAKERGMILYVVKNGRLVRQPWQVGEMIPDHAVWIDMANPTRLQEKTVEEYLGIDIPTREEMHAIEVSDRLYQEKGAYFLTATLITKMAGDEAESHAVTFVVAGDVLVTVRYSDPLPFTIFASQIDKLPASDHNGPALLLGLLDSITNREADMLERIGHDMDTITKKIFAKQPEGSQPMDYQGILAHIGRSGDLVSKARESLMTLARLVAFAMQCNKISAGENQTRLLAQSKDVAGLSDQAGYLATKVNFLLDATLGMISIEQNNIIKIFSVAAVMFLPPTLIASIYGMNFKYMPELHWLHGYPLTLFFMVCSAAFPYFYFKRKNWL